MTLGSSYLVSYILPSALVKNRLCSGFLLLCFAFEAAGNRFEFGQADLAGVEEAAVRCWKCSAIAAHVPIKPLNALSVQQHMVIGNSLQAVALRAFLEGDPERGHCFVVSIVFTKRSKPSGSVLSSISLSKPGGLRWPRVTATWIA